MADDLVRLTAADFDEFGRGPLQREFENRCGFDPKLHLGFKTFIRQLKAAENGGHEWPDQFRAMLLRVVEEIVGPRIEEERMHTLAMAETMVMAVIDDRLEPVRRAFKDLRDQAKRKPVMAGR